MKGAAGKPIRDPRPPTHDDALLLVTILNGAVGEQALDGMELLWTYPEPPSYDRLTRDHPPGSVGFRNVMGLLTVGERLGTFVKNGVLHAALTADLIWIGGVWERTHVVINDLRIQRDNLKLFENLEFLAKATLAE